MLFISASLKNDFFSFAPKRFENHECLKSPPQKRKKNLIPSTPLVVRTPLLRNNAIEDALIRCYNNRIKTGYVNVNSETIRF